MTTDTIIIGSGQAGKPLAFALAAAGRKVALIEREHVGGTCINVGCTPTKTMVASARVAYLARRAREYGVGVGPVEVDMAAVVTRKQAIVERFRNYSTQKLQATEGVDLIFGAARFGAQRGDADHRRPGRAARRQAETPVRVTHSTSPRACHFLCVSELCYGTCIAR